MNASLQASGGRHLAPAVSPYIWRALVWEEIAGREWQLAHVFEMSSFEEAELYALEACTEPYPDGVTAMHYVIGEVANG
jgi:hypothetical protein